MIRSSPTRPFPTRGWRPRRRAVDHVLRAVADTPWADRLVLRGSLLLKAWPGDAARDPGDVDWVVLPPPLKATSPTAIDLLADVTAAVLDRRSADGTEFRADRVRSSAIWTYERAEGRRLVFPWTSGDLPAGVVQLDFVFGEPLPVPPILAEVPPSDGGPPHVVLAASPDCRWHGRCCGLETDWHPQGKDLYDATLLAERAELPVDVLRGLLAVAKPPGYVGHQRLRMFDRNATENARRDGLWHVDWANFTREYPSVSGTASNGSTGFNACFRRHSPTDVRRAMTPVKRSRPAVLSRGRGGITFRFRPIDLPRHRHRPAAERDVRLVQVVLVRLDRSSPAGGSAPSPAAPRRSAWSARRPA